MLRRVTTCDENFDVILLCDPAVWEAQLKAARDLVEKDLVETKSGDFVDTFVDAVRAATGEYNGTAVALAEVKDAGRALLANALPADERDAADERFVEALKDEDLRQCLAWVRGQAAAAAYRSTSDPAKLLDATPDDSTVVTLRAVNRDEQRRIERAVGPRPRLGAVHYSKAADLGRKAAREGGDSGEVFARYMFGLGETEKASVEDFEDWQAEVDRLVCARAVRKISGFDLEPINDEYPILEFLAQVPDIGTDAVAEIAAHCRQVGTLGKSVRSPQHSTLGTVGRGGEAQASQTDGSALNASETAADQASMA